MATFTSAPQSVNTSVDWSAGVLAPPTNQESENSAFTSTERVQFYSDHANKYDDDMVKFSFRGPHVAAQATHNVLNSNYSAYILDVGCGTGKALEELLKLGPYTNVDGLEPAAGMLQLAQQKYIYKNTISQFLNLDCGLEHNKYDAIVSSGTFVAGHMKSDCMVELCNITKPGGYIVVTMRHEHLATVDEYRLHLRSTIDALVAESKWRIIKDELFPDWCFGDDGKGIDGHLFVFQKC